MAHTRQNDKTHNNKLKKKVTFSKKLATTFHYPSPQTELGNASTATTSVTPVSTSTTPVNNATSTLASSSNVDVSPLPFILTMEDLDYANDVSERSRSAIIALEESELLDNKDILIEILKKNHVEEKIEFYLAYKELAKEEDHHYSTKLIAMCDYFIGKSNLTEKKLFNPTVMDSDGSATLYLPLEQLEKVQNIYRKAEKNEKITREDKQNLTRVVNLVLAEFFANPDHAIETLRKQVALEIEKLQVVEVTREKKPKSNKHFFSFLTSALTPAKDNEKKKHTSDKEDKENEKENEKAGKKFKHS